LPGFWRTVRPDRVRLLRQKSNRLLKEGTENSVEWDRLERTCADVSPESVIGARDRELGRPFSREVPQRQAAEPMASQHPKAAGPTCGMRRERIARKRTAISIDGPVRRLLGRSPANASGSPFTRRPKRTSRLRPEKQKLRWTFRASVGTVDRAVFLSNPRRS